MSEERPAFKKQRRCQVLRPVAVDGRRRESPCASIGEQRDELEKAEERVRKAVGKNDGQRARSFAFLAMKWRCVPATVARECRTRERSFCASSSGAPVGSVGREHDLADVSGRTRAPRKRPRRGKTGTSVRCGGESGHGDRAPSALSASPRMSSTSSNRCPGSRRPRTCCRYQRHATKAWRSEKLPEGMEKRCPLTAHVRVRQTERNEEPAGREERVALLPVGASQRVENNVHAAPARDAPNFLDVVDGTVVDDVIGAVPLHVFRVSSPKRCRW